MPISLIPTTCPWLTRGQVLRKNHPDNEKSPDAVVLSVDNADQTFVMRTCNVLAGMVGPTTKIPISTRKVGKDDSFEYSIIGTLRPEPVVGQILDAVDGGSFRVMSVSPSSGSCLLSRWDRARRQLTRASSSQTVLLDETFWNHLEVFWHRQYRYRPGGQ